MTTLGVAIGLTVGAFLFESDTAKAADIAMTQVIACIACWIAQEVFGS
jgi:hypothetical protein